MGADLLALVWAVRLSDLTPWVETLAAGLLVGASVSVDGRDLLCWIQGVKDEFLERPPAFVLGLIIIDAAAISAGTVILLIGVLEALERRRLEQRRRDLAKYRRATRRYLVSMVARQLGLPHGLRGRFLGYGIARNGEFNRWVVQVLKELSPESVERIVELGPLPGIGLEALLQ